MSTQDGCAFLGSLQFGTEAWISVIQTSDYLVDFSALGSNQPQIQALACDQGLVSLQAAASRNTVLHVTPSHQCDSTTNDEPRPAAIFKRVRQGYGCASNPGSGSCSCLSVAVTTSVSSIQHTLSILCSSVLSQCASCCSSDSNILLHHHYPRSQTI